MARSERDSTPLGDGRWLRDRSSRTGVLRLAGLALVVGIVAGAVAVRLGGDDPAPPGLYDAPDTTAPVVAPDSATVPEPASGGAPAADTAGPIPGAHDTGAPGTGTPGGGGPSARAAGAEDPAPVPVGAARAVDAAVAAADSLDVSDADSIYVPPTPPGGWAAASEPSPLTRSPVPDSLRVPKPAAVRGIYIGSWSPGDRRRLATLLELADETEVNAFVIDVKDVTGEVSYETRVPLAAQVEADRRVRIRDIRAVLDSLRAHGVYAIARIVAFKDPLLAVARPEWSVQLADGSPWEDDNGVRWVDSFNPNVWDYNIELAREAIALGFGEIQWDYVRFPDVPREFAVTAVYPARDGRTKIEGIRAFLGRAGAELDTLGVPMTADVFGITTSTQRDIGIGQMWEEMSDRVDVLLPMVYPSHYPPGSWDYPNPNAAPYQIVRRALDDGVERSVLIPNAASIRPWLQAFSLGEPEYGPRHIRAQIDAVYDAGLDEWILWHPGVRYPREALADAYGMEPWFAGMGAALYEPPPEPVDTADHGGPAPADTASAGESPDTVPDRQPVTVEPADTGSAALPIRPAPPAGPASTRSST